MKYFISLIVIAVGAILVIKSDWFVANFGTIGWAEAHLGSEGGTRAFYKILGVLIIIGTFVALTGALGAALRGVFPIS